MTPAQEILYECIIGSSLVNLVNYPERFPYNRERYRDLAVSMDRDWRELLRYGCLSELTTAFTGVFGADSAEAFKRYLAAVIDAVNAELEAEACEYWSND